MNGNVDAEFVVMLQTVIENLTLERDCLLRSNSKLASRNVELAAKNAELQCQIDIDDYNGGILW